MLFEGIHDSSKGMRSLKMALQNMLTMIAIIDMVDLGYYYVIFPHIIYITNAFLYFYCYKYLGKIKNTFIILLCK